MRTMVKGRRADPRHTMSDAGSFPVRSSRGGPRCADAATDAVTDVVVEVIEVVAGAVAAVAAVSAGVRVRAGAGAGVITFGPPT